MAVPGSRHGHMDALWGGKRNPTVFSSDTNGCRLSGGWAGVGSGPQRRPAATTWHRTGVGR